MCTHHDIRVIVCHSNRKSICDLTMLTYTELEHVQSKLHYNFMQLLGVFIDVANRKVRDF